MRGVIPTVMWVVSLSSACLDTPSDGRVAGRREDDVAIAPDVVATVEGEAVMSAREGANVLPQTTLHFDASWPGEEVVTHRWTVEQPAGSTSVFRPSADVPAPTFEANIAGEYGFEVAMTTADGKVARRRYRVYAASTSRLHVELIWSTLGDPDPSDEGAHPPDGSSTDLFTSAGTDLDLHLAPRGVGTWSDGDGDGAPDPWLTDDDCYWYNPAPGSDFETSPTLDRDDTDGWGPENINLDVPSPGVCYDIAVHYWDDWGYGESIPEVRVYFADGLAARASATLVQEDLWRVGTVCPDARTFTAAERCAPEGCAPWIVHAYDNAFEHDAPSN